MQRYRLNWSNMVRMRQCKPLIFHVGCVSSVRVSNQRVLMKPWIKFWIAATVLLFLLALWPFTQLGGSRVAAAPAEQEFAEQARLVDYFCLGKLPSSGKASIPKEWETALEADIRVRESAGEAAGDIGFPREQAERLTSLEPGEGLLHSDNKGYHYVLKSNQGRGGYIVLSKTPRSGGVISPSGSAGPSPVAMAAAFAVVAAAILTLLARVAYGRPSE